jgi:short subunit dehydrogenase-like uncharacterized protein
MKIAVYGANGYQGKLVVAELARRDIETVLAGRDSGRLKGAAAEVGVSGAELRVADIDDHEALVSAFRGSDTVINCAGPFTRSGAKVVRAAIAAGCHHVDTSGEQLYIKSVYDTFMGDAERAGVTVVPAATDAGVPGDLIAHLLAERLGPIDRLTTAHRIVGGGGMSRGSLRTVLEIRDIVQDGGLGYEDGEWRTGTFAAPAPITFPGESHATAVMRFPLQEVVTVPRHLRVRSVQGVVEAALSTAFSTPVAPEVIDNLPEGPDEQSRNAQRWTIVIDAICEDGRRARGVVQGPDTYGTTAVIAVESARLLGAVRAPAGVRAPAQAFNPAGFLDSLAPHGVSWNIEVHEQPA